MYLFTATLFAPRDMATSLLIIIGFYVAVSSSQKCTKDEFICSDNCSQLVRCSSLGNGTFIRQVVRKCPGTISQFCNATALDCAGYSCEDAGIEPAVVTCHEDGTYPHPTNCSQYFVCTKGVIAPITCPVNTSYNALFKNCSLTLSARACEERPIPPCESVATIGAYPEDPEIFYLCAFDGHGYLRPEFHRCVDGNVFDPEEETCVLKSGSGNFFGSLFVVIFSMMLIRLL